MIVDWAVMSGKAFSSCFVWSSKSPGLNKPVSSLPKTDIKDGKEPDIIVVRSASMLMFWVKDERRFDGG